MASDHKDLTAEHLVIYGAAATIFGFVLSGPAGLIIVNVFAP
jgi:hypothetical protein